MVTVPLIPNGELAEITLPSTDGLHLAVICRKVRLTIDEIEQDLLALHDSALVISTEAGKDVCEAAVAEIYKEMDILRNELIDDEELLLVRNYLIGIILGDLDGPFHIISRWKNIILNNLDEQYFYNSVDTIKNISADELKQLANKYFIQDNFYELVVI